MISTIPHKSFGEVIESFLKLQPNEKSFLDVRLVEMNLNHSIVREIIGTVLVEQWKRLCEV